LGYVLLDVWPEVLDERRRGWINGGHTGHAGMPRLPARVDLVASCGTGEGARGNAGDLAKQASAVETIRAESLPMVSTTCRCGAGASSVENEL